MAYVVFASYTKRTTATGVLLPIHGMVRLMAPIDDVVSQCRVEEGQHVRRGDVPCVLADGRAQLSGAAVRTLSQVHHASFEQRRVRESLNYWFNYWVETTAQRKMAKSNGRGAFPMANDAAMAVSRLPDVITLSDVANSDGPSIDWIRQTASIPVPYSSLYRDSAPCYNQIAV